MQISTTYKIITYLLQKIQVRAETAHGEFILLFFDKMLINRYNVQRMKMVVFTRKLYTYRSIIVSMAVQDIQRRYAGTVAGFIWSIINPLVTILVYWFVFSVGLRVQPIGDVPFILFFAAALLPWMTFSETILINTNVIAANSHLIKKMVFPSEILPFVTLVANLITHFVMLTIFMGIMLAYGRPLSFMNLQCLYYMFAMCALIFLYHIHVYA
ncbi:teichoic acid ABC transporter permease [Candidatus Magnetobacterium bavaricum]|uniref:Teichoic acid ABC transporter permease n=1 Tax=Candidatus Magnetobacterium bavaricum TaxID=29290 RepID=A0A0F3GSK6_9BACT|nr:teichoic acid ABC transporter permease [Candidatus Magnetobacterium bavaricum]